MEYTYYCLISSRYSVPMWAKSRNEDGYSKIDEQNMWRYLRSATITNNTFQIKWRYEEQTMTKETPTYETTDEQRRTATVVLTPQEHQCVWTRCICRSSSLLHLFVLKFYGPVKPMGSCLARSVYPNRTFTGQA